MKVKLVWEDCNFLNGSWSNKVVTSYWLEVEKGEIENILSYAKFPELILQEIEQNKSIEDNKLYFLVAKNLEFIKSFPSFYPYSGQWNGYSPFLEIPETKISDLDELPTLELRF
ncbi:MAG: hypothetical protein V7L20_20825 [Nostoc sp.]|uniref:hypothetical protein n=1 Tax=Nostoc sp. TaxID=1180 RepID=UPI002FF5E787